MIYSNQKYYNFMNIFIKISNNQNNNTQKKEKMNKDIAF